MDTQTTQGPVPNGITHFYRYGSRLDWLEPIILNHRIYAPLPRELNDPLEARPRLEDVNAEEMSEYLKSVFKTENPYVGPERYAEVSADIDAGVKAASIEQLRPFAMERLYSLLEKRRIFSMSKRWNNFAMWANYANNHRGYCLEFTRTGEFATAREVVYTDTFRFDLCNPSPENAELYFCKTPEWSYEEEVRRVFPRTFIGPHFPIEPGWLTRIVVGKDMSDTDRQRIGMWAAQRVPRLAVTVAEFDGYTQELRLRPADADT